MDTMLKNASTAELHSLMDTLSSTSEMSAKQTELLFAVIDELTERGELPSITQNEIDASRDKIWAAISAEESEKNDHVHWFERAVSSIQSEYSQRKKRRSRAFKTVAAVAMIAILVNAGTSLAWNRNYLGEILQLAGQALTSMFAQEPKLDVSGLHPEMIPLAEQLFEFNLDTKLPTWVPEGAQYGHIEITYDEEPYHLTAWFVFWLSEKEFSIMIGKDIFDTSSMRVEANEDDALPPIDHGATTYHITLNKGRMTALWQDGDYQLILQGDLSYEEVEAIILSIPEE